MHRTICTVRLIRFNFITMVLLSALLAPNALKAEQSISSYNPNHPLIIARQEALNANLDPNLVLAILAHESHDCRLPTTAKTDLGCMQISRATAKAMHLDPYRLVVDRRYNIKAGCKVLLHFKRYAKSDKKWYTRYNTGNRDLLTIRQNYALKLRYQLE